MRVKADMFVPIILVGNKMDKECDRVVDKKTARQIAMEWQVIFIMDTSSF